MEIKQHIPVQIYLIFVIYSIIFLSGIGAYAHIPSLSSNVGKFQVSTCNLSVDHSKNSNPNSIACFPCSHKYPLKSYFEKHDSLLDSDFQDFLSLDSCKGMVHNLSSMLRMSLFQRRLNGEGSHRLLVSSMKFDIHSDSIYEQATQDCEAVVIERLPLGVFADPFELQHLVQHVFVDAAVFGDTNLELPSALSKRSVVEIHINISRSILSWQNKGLNITVEVPLHARYPPLDGSDYSRIEMRLPDLLMDSNYLGSQFHDFRHCCLANTLRKQGTRGSCIHCYFCFSLGVCSFNCFYSDILTIILLKFNEWLLTS
ncbi:uncharacterized protein LOC143892921 isoform X2 [Tasmannia lanceolata]|uniref:uncharacterized protein LOC143892921 isoform X2 n=1 Tax=Tasmannia lanceolata TaxID=3420 RepID=UPI00406370F1